MYKLRFRKKHLDISPSQKKEWEGFKEDIEFLKEMISEKSERCSDIWSEVKHLQYQDYVKRNYRELKSIGSLINTNTFKIYPMYYNGLPDESVQGSFIEDLDNDIKLHLNQEDSDILRELLGNIRHNVKRLKK